MTSTKVIQETERWHTGLRVSDVELPVDLIEKPPLGAFVLVYPFSSFLFGAKL